MPDNPRDSALTTLRSFARRQAHQVVDVHDGFAVLDQRYPMSYHHNRLIVTGRPAPAEIIATADAVLGGVGLTHRMVSVEDDQHGSTCVPAMNRAGYRCETNLVMCHPGGPGRQAGSAIAVESVSMADLAESAGEEWRARLPNADEATITQLVHRRATLPQGAERVRFLAVRDATGRVLSHADLYLHATATGRIAQIEDLITGQGHTGNGYAGAVVSEALRIAREAACDLVFLVADADDWPQRWYRRLGFTTVGRYRDFVRTGDVTADPHQPCPDQRPPSP